jgi:hypothetical protein
LQLLKSGIPDVRDPGLPNVPQHCAYRKGTQRISSTGYAALACSDWQASPQVISVHTNHLWPLYIDRQEAAQTPSKGVGRTEEVGLRKRKGSVRPLRHSVPALLPTLRQSARHITPIHHTARIANRPPLSQKRHTIRDSASPRKTKWLCSGLQRSTRLPRSRNEAT